MAGKKLLQMPVGSKEVKLDMTGLSDGVYLLNYNDAVRSQVMKIHKQ